MSGSLGERLGEIFFPHLACAACGGSGELARGVCGACLGQMERFRLTADQPEIAVCGRAYASSYGAYVYRGCVRQLIRAMKFGSEARPALALFVPAMAELARGTGLAGDVVVQVPLAKARVRERGYNQSALLAKGVARSLGLPMREGLVWRNRATMRQTKLARGEREDNVRGAFSAGARSKGLRVLLVDDVLTSGSTASACAQALLDAGAARVDVLAAARAILSSDWEEE